MNREVLRSIRSKLNFGCLASAVTKRVAEKQPSDLDSHERLRQQWLMPLLITLAVSLLYLSGDQAQPKVTISQCEYPPPPPTVTIDQVKTAIGQSEQLFSPELPSDPSYDPYFSIWEIFYISDLMRTLSQNPQNINNTTIDILTVETTSTQSVPEIDKLIADQIVYANVAAARTGSEVRSRHVGVHHSSHNEVLPYEENLYQLIGCEGYLESACQAKKDFGADQTTLLISPNTLTACGMAYQPLSITQKILSNSALSLVTLHPGCLFEGALTHESLGHNLTMGHNIEDSYLLTHYPWAHGARTREVVLLRFYASRSIMAYRFPDNTPINIGFPGYSSPELILNGVTLGNVETANNALVFKTVAPIFAENSPTKVGPDLTVFPPAQLIYLPTEPITISVKSLLPQSVIMLKSLENQYSSLYRTRTGADNTATLSVESMHISPVNTYSINVNGGHPETFEVQYLLADKRVEVTVVMPDGHNKTGLLVSAPFAHQSTKTNSDGVVTLDLVGRDQIIRAVGLTPDRKILCSGEVEYSAGDNRTVYEISMRCAPPQNVFLPIVGNNN